MRRAPFALLSSLRQRPLASVLPKCRKESGALKAGTAFYRRCGTSSAYGLRCHATLSEVRTRFSPTRYARRLSRPKGRSAQRLRPQGRTSFVGWRMVLRYPTAGRGLALPNRPLRPLPAITGARALSGLSAPDPNKRCTVGSRFRGISSLSGFCLSCAAARLVTLAAGAPPPYGRRPDWRRQSRGGPRPALRRSGGPRPCSLHPAANGRAPPRRPGLRESGLRGLQPLRLFCRLALCFRQSFLIFLGPTPTPRARPPRAQVYPPKKIKKNFIEKATHGENKNRFANETQKDFDVFGAMPRTPRRFAILGMRRDFFLGFSGRYTPRRFAIRGDAPNPKATTQKIRRRRWRRCPRPNTRRKDRAEREHRAGARPISALPGR